MRQNISFAPVAVSYKFFNGTETAIFQPFGKMIFYVTQGFSRKVS